MSSYVVDPKNDNDISIKQEIGDADNSYVLQAIKISGRYDIGNLESYNKCNEEY